MIVATVKYNVTEGSRERVIELSAGIRAYARSLPGNIEYCPTPSPYEPTTVHSIEKWETLEAMQDYCDSQECKDFQQARNEYLVPGTMDAHVYEVKEIPLGEVMRR